MSPESSVIPPEDHCWISRVDHRDGVDWLESEHLVPYPAAIGFMERRAAAIYAGSAGECVWLLEHPPLYTAGTSAQPDELLDAQRFPVFASGRGGRFTYHGPGQRVIYPMLDLRRRGRDVRAFVEALEAWLIRSLAELGVLGEVRPGRIGVWTAHPQAGEAKIAAIGVRIRRWISYHGAALNVAPELDHFRGIVPCGLPEHRVTSLRDLGLPTTMRAVDDVLKATFPQMMPAPAALPSAQAVKSG